MDKTIERINDTLDRYEQLLKKNVKDLEKVVSLIEEIQENLKKEEKIINGKLNTNYSLIRLSAGLINDELDIWKAIEKLCYINSKY